MTNTFNVYDNIRTPKISQTTTINEWFALIKQSAYSSLIESARPFGKKHPVYEANKAAIPAITYNFTFKAKTGNDKKCNANISVGTGLLYLDVDDLSYDINLLDKSKIFAYYKSFGGDGYAILVQVSGLTFDNYEATYTAISTDLGLTKIYDKGAKKATQFNVLSYDPNIYINYDSFVFTANTSNEFWSPIFVIKKEKKTYTTIGDQNINSSQGIRFDNLDEVKKLIPEGEEHIANWEGWVYIKCWLPMKQVTAGNRNNTLLSYCTNLVWLNPYLNTAGAESIVNRVNQRICEVPVSIAQIKRIVASIFKYKAEGSLHPIVNYKTRKVVFANYSTLSGEQKFMKAAKLYREHRSGESKQKINDVIDVWDFNTYGKITTKAVAKAAGVSEKTVKKHWHEFKTHAKDLNNNWKNPLIETPVEAQVLNMAGGHAQTDKSDREVIITNPERYRRGTQLLTLLERFEIEARLTYLLNSGFIGEAEIVVDDTVFVFSISDTVEFVGFGEMVKVA